MTNIYALIDPRDQQIRYVGKTVASVERRLSQHIHVAPKTHTYSARWICGLLTEGLRPIAKLLETVADDWQEAERRWIAHYREMGMPLTNHTAGGDGLETFTHSDAARAKMSSSQRHRFATRVNPLKGRKRPAEVMEKMAAKIRGRKATPEQIARLSAARKLIPISPETRAKMAATMRGKPKPPRSAEHCRKIAEAAIGRKPSEESNAARSLALSGVHKSAEHRQKLSEAAKRRYARAEA